MGQVIQPTNSAAIYIAAPSTNPNPNSVIEYDENTFQGGVSLDARLFAFKIDTTKQLFANAIQQGKEVVILLENFKDLDLFKLKVSFKILTNILASKINLPSSDMIAFVIPKRNAVGYVKMSDNSTFSDSIEINIPDINDYRLGFISTAIKHNLNVNRLFDYVGIAVSISYDSNANVQPYGIIINLLGQPRVAPKLIVIAKPAGPDGAMTGVKIPPKNS